MDKEYKQQKQEELRKKHIEKTMQNVDQVKGNVQIEHYAGANFGIDPEFDIDMLLFDTLLVHLSDGDVDNKKLDGIYVPTGTSDRKVWRTGKVIMTGTGCRHLKEGDYVIFPCDKGIISKSLNVEGYGTLRDCVFIAEDRIFARAKIRQ